MFFFYCTSGLHVLHYVPHLQVGFWLGKTKFPGLRQSTALSGALGLLFLKPPYLNMNRLKLI